jgi:intracellular sulfur oxidation DsrE/DsrF family protein
MKVLNIVETAYRATLEEQDDPVIWIIHAMKGAGADHAVLLQGNAVNYTVTAQGVRPLTFGLREQKQAPHLAEQVGGLVTKGVEVMVSEECLTERGIAADELIAGMKMVKKADLPKLLSRFDQVWHW